MTRQRTWRGRAFLGMSLDGYIAREDGDVAWLENLPLNAGHAVTGTQHPALVWETFFPEIDTLLMGRGTYEKVTTFSDWPYPDQRVLVMSTSAEVADDRVEVVRSIDDAVAALSAAGARNVYVDGGLTVSAFLRRGLLDELTVAIAPIILGAGTPLFAAGGAQVPLRVRGSHVTEEGLVRVTYDVG